MSVSVRGKGQPCGGKAVRKTMKLVELNPRWSVDADIIIGDRVVHDPERHGMGLSFDCPCCVGTSRATRLAVFFRNPIDGKVASDDYKNLWLRTGDSFDTLTLSPSVDASGHGHWHLSATVRIIH
mgnify:CR=1 FL=1